MLFISAKLRDAKVFAKAQQDGSLLEEGGRVTIRYQLGGKSYQALARNLVVTGAELVEGPDDEDLGGASGPENGARATRKASPAASVEPNNESYVFYTDGACSGNPGPAGVGVVAFSPDGKTSDGYEYLGIATNNVAELTAILRAVELVPESAKAFIHTDSKYAIGVLSQGWKAKVNQALIATIRALLTKRPHVQFRYVPGHSGVKYNEKADELARLAVSSKQSSLPAFGR